MLLVYLAVAAVGLREVVNSSTFQLFGDYVARVDTDDRVVAREVIRRGHEVGNHSYSHAKLVLMSPRRVRDEIDRTDKLRDIGVFGEICFRPPHASKFIVLPYVLGLAARGYRFDTVSALVRRSKRPGSSS